MGKKANGNSHKNPDPTRRSFLKMGLGLGAYLGLVVCGGAAPYLLLRKREKQPNPDLLEQVIDSDYLTEKFVTDKFEDFTPADQATLDFFVEKLNKYYQKLDQLIAGGKHFAEKETSDLINLDVLTPLIQQIWQHNQGLQGYINQQSHHAQGLKGDDFLIYILNYFKEKGFYCSAHDFPNDAGIIHSQRIAKIEKITCLEGQLWGNKISRQKVHYLSWPCLAEEYLTRSRLKEGCRTAENQNGDILIFLGSQEYSFKMLLNGLNNFDSKRNITCRDDLFKNLMVKGLEESLASADPLQDYTRKKIKSDFFHETAHTLYRQAHPDDKAHDFDALNRNELCSFLTELKNEQTSFIYFTLGTIFNSLDPRRYLQANQTIFSFFLTDMVKNRHDYPLINFHAFDQNHKDIESLLFQLPKLSVEQIGTLAGRCFGRYLPELNKL